MQPAAPSMQEARGTSSSQPRSPPSGGLYPKSSAFSGSVHAQKDPSKAEEILATSKDSLPSALHLPSLPQSKKAGVTEQWDSKQGKATWVSAGPQV